MPLAEHSTLVSMATRERLPFLRRWHPAKRRLVERLTTPLWVRVWKRSALRPPRRYGPDAATLAATTGTKVARLASRRMDEAEALPKMTVEIPDLGLFKGGYLPDHVVRRAADH